jgi:hypothetical protein
MTIQPPYPASPYLSRIIEGSTSIVDLSGFLLHAEFQSDSVSSTPKLIGAEWEIVEPANTKYSFSSISFNTIPPLLPIRTAASSELLFTPNSNGVHTIRVRGLLDQNLFTNFSDPITITVNVPVPTVSIDISKEKIVNLPTSGPTVILNQETHVFQYDSVSVYPIKQVEYSLDGGDWQIVEERNGLIVITNLVGGTHSLQIRILDQDDQYSTVASLTFIVDLSTFVTIDIYPTDPLCGPERTFTIGGVREANSIVTSLKGVLTDTLRFPSEITWEADLYVFGDGEQIVEIEVQNVFGNKALTSQKIQFKNRPPKLYVSELASNTHLSKAILRGSKDLHTAIEISHNQGPWTTIIASDVLSTWQYVLELVSGENEIRVRSYDESCGSESKIITVQTIYLDASSASGAFKINNGDYLTQSTEVVLSFVSSTSKRILISNFLDFKEGFETDYKESLPWTVSAEPGIKTIYVKFVDNLGNVSSVYNDDILLVSSSVVASESPSSHQVYKLQATNTITQQPLGTIILVKDNRNGTYSVIAYQNPENAYAGTQPIAIAITNTIGKQTLTWSNIPGSGMNIVGTVEVEIVKGAEDFYADHRLDVFDITNGESTIPLQYKVREDALYFYATIDLPYYESRFIGGIQEIILLDQITKQTTLKIDKIFTLIKSIEAQSGYGYETAFAQARENIPTPLKDQFTTYPLSGMRFWYPTLPEYAMILEIEENSDSYTIKIDQLLLAFEDNLASQIEFTRQSKTFIDYRVSKATGVVEFINESTYATGNALFEYEYAKINKGRPDVNWYKLCGLKYNDLITLTFPQTVNRVTLEQLKKLCIRFYNGDEGTSPKIVRFIINDTIVYEDKSSDIIEGPTGYGYSYEPSGYGYKMKPGLIDQVLEFCAENVVSSKDIVQKIQVEFRATSPCMYIGELVVSSETVPVDTNLEILVNGDLIYRSQEPVSKTLDTYEMRMEKNEIDIWYNGKFIKNIKVPNFDSENVKRFIGAEARTSGDKVIATFGETYDKKYYDVNPISVSMIGRFMGIEPNVREQ